MARQPNTVITFEDLNWMTTNLRRHRKKKTIPSTKEGITKAEIREYFEAEEGLYADYSDKRLVPYQKIRSKLKRVEVSKAHLMPENAADDNMTDDVYYHDGSTIKPKLNDWMYVDPYSNNLTEGPLTDWRHIRDEECVFGVDHNGVVQRILYTDHVATASNVSLPNEAGERQINVLSNTSWSVSMASTWCRIIGASTGTGNGSFRVQHDENTSTTQLRDINFTLSTTTGARENIYKITQNKASIAILNHSGTTSLPSTNAFTNVYITTDGPWHLEETGHRANFNSSSGGTSLNGTAVNNKLVTVYFDNNDSTDSRTLTLKLTVGGETDTVTFTQAKHIFMNLDISTKTVTASAGSFTFEVDSNVSWSASESSDFFSISHTNGTAGKTNVTVTYYQNHGASRTNNITITGGGITKTVKVTQSAIQLYSVTLHGTGTNINDFKGASTPDAAMSNGIVKLAWATETVANIKAGTQFFENSSATSHVSGDTGWYKIGGTTLAVRIDVGGYFLEIVDTSMTISVSPTTRNFTSSGGSSSFYITSNTDWSINKPSWITIASNNMNGSGNKTIPFSVSSTTYQRSGSIRVHNEYREDNVVVTQTPPVSLAINPTSYNSSSMGGNFNIQITATGTWTATTGGISGLSIIGSSSGSGNGQITVSVPKNFFQQSILGFVQVTSGGISKNCNITLQGVGGGGLDPW